MTLSLTESLAGEWLELEAELRQQSFFDYLPKTLEVWGLCDTQGWVMSKQQQSEYLPLWSHALLAQKWADKYKPTANPTQISLHEFKTTWLPGLKSNDIGLLIGASTSRDDSIHMSVDEFIHVLG